jgi:hypothetical protein
MIEYFRMNIEYLRYAFGGSIIKKTSTNLSRPIAGVTSNAKEILSQQAARTYTLIEIELAKRHAAQALALREQHSQIFNGQFRFIRVSAILLTTEQICKRIVKRGFFLSDVSTSDFRIF